MGFSLTRRFRLASSCSIPSCGPSFLYPFRIPGKYFWTTRLNRSWLAWQPVCLFQYLGALAEFRGKSYRHDKGYAVLRHTLAPPLNYSKGSKFESMSQEQTKEAQSPAHEIDLEMNVDDSSDFAVVDSPVSRLITNGRGKGHGLE